MTTHSYRSDSFYVELGGEQALRDLVELFYDIVEADPEAAPLMKLHLQGTGMQHTREAQFEFLSGFLGGPQIYLEKHQHANVKRMHAHLQIGTAERDAWLSCMDKALQQTGTTQELHQRLMTSFTRVADVLINTNTSPTSTAEAHHG